MLLALAGRVTWGMGRWAVGLWVMVMVMVMGHGHGSWAVGHGAPV